jgi:hypothetical protein
VSAAVRTRACVAEEVLLSRTDAGAIAAGNANWDKAAEHAARYAPYLHHKRVAVDKSQSRKLSEMTTEELEAVAQEAREELGNVRDEEQALVQEAHSKAVH